MAERPQHRRTDTVRAITRQVEEMHWASERIGQLFAQRHDLHDTDLRALTAVYRAELAGRPLTASGLAEELQLSPAAITYAVGRLCTSGHLQRDRDPADGRRVVLRCAQAGLDVSGAFFGPLAAAQVEALADFSEDELDAARRVLAALVASLESYGDQLRAGPEEDPGHPGK